MIFINTLNNTTQNSILNWKEECIYVPNKITIVSIRGYELTGVKIKRDLNLLRSRLIKMLSFIFVRNQSLVLTP